MGDADISRREFLSGALAGGFLLLDSKQIAETMATLGKFGENLIAALRERGHDQPTEFDYDTRTGLTFVRNTAGQVLDVISPPANIRSPFDQQYKSQILWNTYGGKRQFPESVVLSGSDSQSINLPLSYDNGVIINTNSEASPNLDPSNLQARIDVTTGITYINDSLGNVLSARPAYDIKDSFRQQFSSRVVYQSNLKAEPAVPMGFVMTNRASSVEMRGNVNIIPGATLRK